MDKDLAVVEPFFDCFYNKMTEVVTRFNRHQFRHDKMHINVTNMTGLTRPQLVIFQKLPGVLLHDLMDNYLLVMRMAEGYDKQRGIQPLEREDCRSLDDSRVSGKKETEYIFECYSVSWSMAP